MAWGELYLFGRIGAIIEFSELAGRPPCRALGGCGGEESPDSREQERRIIPGRREATDSAAENKPPKSGGDFGSARVKRCGKSAPRPRRQGRHGKPRSEQG